RSSLARERTARITMRIDPDRWERLQALFHEALDRAPSERESFLDEHCGDAELRADVQALLDADEGAASVLDRDLPSIADDLFDRPLPGGGVIGPYRLIRPIGEGGMGIVYLAERADLQNRVAIKMLRDAWVSPARRERFASEQRTLAMLGHPSIARVLDAATLPDGTPYFVMEYVEGTEI